MPTTQNAQPDSQSTVVNQLLTHIAVDRAEQYLRIIQWLRDRYSWQTSNGWHKLTDLAKRNLRQWIGGISYGDFRRLADKLLQNLLLQPHEENQLRSRRTFWSNYSRRFQSDLRILLPYSSVAALAGESFPEADILLEDNSDPTEICIFNLGKLLVVEFFRGDGSETRIFPYSTNLENFLFSNSRLSVKRIRCQGGEVFDHAFGWQGICIQYLESHNISANPGITEFYGLPGRCNSYRPGQGISSLSSEDQATRERSLRNWKPKMARLQEEAQRFCDRLEP
ncbi:MAG: hypothetical protein HC772_10605 [Leptolyngbyaceae cyanobacterium CRU_2_3]|nr:hypothetical protein [Leptolyngbyaceae cyanobacterium CRU_2_3]